MISVMIIEELMNFERKKNDKKFLSTTESERK